MNKKLFITLSVLCLSMIVFSTTVFASNGRYANSIDDPTPTNPNGYQSSIIDRLFVFEEAVLPTTRSDYVTVDVNCACDEEWRNMADWEDEAHDAVENADDAFFTTFHINFNVAHYANWDSDDSKSDQDSLNEAISEIGLGGYDLMVAFSDQSASYAGWGRVGGPYSLVYDWGSTNNKKITQHEVSHNYGCSHSTCDGGTCVIADTYGSFGNWCSTCSDTIDSNREDY